MLRRQAADSQEILRLTKIIGALRQKLFGTGQSEKVDHAQLQIQLGLAEAQLTSLSSPAQKNEEDRKVNEAIEQSRELAAGEPVTRVKRYSLPDDIEEREVRIIPPEVTLNPEDYREIGQPEVTEIIDLEPAKFIKLKQVFPRFVPKADKNCAPITAPRPPRVLLGGIATVRLLVHVLLAKYMEHMPLYRQEQSFRLRYDVRISRKTMGGWIGHLVEQWLSMIYESIKSDIRRSAYLGADETPIICLDRDFGKGSRKAYLWVYINEHGECIYEWHMGRSAKCAESMLVGYEGLLQSDAYAVYDSLGARESFIQIGCMAHARRKFHEAWHDHDERASGQYILLIAKLYRIERILKKYPNRDLSAMRRRFSSPVLKQIKLRLDGDLQSLNENSKSYEAVQYALNHWDKLCRYTDHSLASIDNNAAERAIRPSKLGMKNWLFVGHPKAGKWPAVIYTIVQNCIQHGANPEEYLNDILEKLPHMTNNPEGIRQLQPKHWVKNQANP